MLPTPVFSLLACGSKKRANPNLTGCIQFIKKVIGSWSEYLNQKRAGRPSKAHVNGTAVVEAVKIQQRLADQGYYKSKIAGIEKGYAGKRDKREARLKERIAVLEKKIQEIND